MPTLAVTAVPAFDDNYLWLVHAPADPQQVLVVDPGDATAVKAALHAQGLVLAGILVTHHHGDHVGGVQALAAGAALPVFGPGNEDIEGITHFVQGGDRVELPELGLSFAVLAVPGHTRGHIAYAGHGAVFCGDTLFAAGCGRLFEGSPEQMHHSLGLLAALPETTRVWCAHEYTASNLRWAAAQRPGDGAIAERLAAVLLARTQNRPTIPSSIGEERRTNLFMRAADGQELAALRRSKNDWSD
jgi:hydroxyacylglutathione hydrolase